MDGSLTVDGIEYSFHADNHIPRSLHARVRYWCDSLGTYAYDPTMFDFEIPVGDGKLRVAMSPAGMTWRGRAHESDYIQISAENARGSLVENYIPYYLTGEG